MTTHAIARNRCSAGERHFIWGRSITPTFSCPSYRLDSARFTEEFMYVANAKRLTLTGARKMMDTATALAERDGIAISVAIADAGGHLMLFQRMDGGRFHTVHSSTTKA